VLEYGSPCETGKWSSEATREASVVSTRASSFISSEWFSARTLPSALAASMRYAKDEKRWSALRDQNVLRSWMDLVEGGI
jgi:hypothetical protein